jgi:hypothetical protein
MAIALSDATLGDLPESVLRPTYDRARLTPGILHIGLGNFHRAHQSWYLHRLMQQGLAQDWAIIGAGVRPYDAAQREKMRAQDYLTTLIELDPAGKSAEVVGSMIDYVPVEEGNGPLIARMAEPDIRIVSLTVTEGGYYTDPATGGLDAAHPDIAPRRRRARPSPHRLRRHGRGAPAPPRPRRRAVHRPVLRQPPGQRRHPAPHRGLARPPLRPGAGRLDRRALHVPQRHGRLHRPRHRPARNGAGARVRRRRRRAGHP